MIIEQAIHAIDPDYEITAKQQREIDSADDPEGVAAVLAEQVALNRKLIAQGFNVSPEHVTAANGLSVAVLSRPVANRVGSGVAERVAEMVPVRRALEIGRRSAAKPDETDPVTWAFRRFLGRDPQSLGMNHYTAELARGRPVWDIIREIELSDEARGVVT